MKQRQLWIARHAQPLIEPGRCYGALDVPADVAATAHSAQQLAQALPQGVLAYHSPLQRCEQLAQALQGLRPDLASKVDTRLAEMDFGNWEGRYWDDIARTDIDAWAAHFATHRPGGGENLATVLARVAAALHEARQAARQYPTDVLWIAHAGVARCVQWLAQSPASVYPRADQWPVAAPALGAWAIWAL